MWKSQAQNNESDTIWNARHKGETNFFIVDMEINSVKVIINKIKIDRNK